jgi:RHS repeat-associated protein
VGDQIPGSAYWATWQFDPLGNRTKQTGHSLAGGQNTVTTSSYNGNGAGQPDTLTSTSTTGPSGLSSASYSYDPAGNTLTRNLPGGNQTLAWTHDGKLATDTTPAGTTSYIYDADGNLLLQKDPGLTTLFLFGGTQQITLTTSGPNTGTITGTRFIAIPGGGEVVRTSSSYTFELANQQHTGVLTLDSTLRNPVWRQFTPYGAPRGTPPPAWPDANGFLGKPADASTSLTTVGARQYDPATGRFLSVDPVLDASSPQQLTGYGYAGDNPATFADPTGLHYPGCSGGYPVHCGPYHPGGGGPGPGPGGGPPPCPGYLPGCPGFTGGGGPLPPPLTPNQLLGMHDSGYRGTAQPTPAALLSWLRYGGAGAWDFFCQGLLHRPVSACAADPITGQSNIYDSGIHGNLIPGIAKITAVIGGNMMLFAFGGPEMEPVDDLVALAAEGAVDPTAARLQAYADAAASKFESGDIGLSPAQARAAAANPSLQPAFRGQVIDAAVKQAAANDPKLGSLYITRSGEFGPDFLDLNSVPGTPRWYDVTTQDNWLAHVTRYADFGQGTGIFYGGG